jgi:hypothetical protein
VLALVLMALACFGRKGGGKRVRVVGEKQIILPPSPGRSSIVSTARRWACQYSSSTKLGTRCYTMSVEWEWKSWLYYNYLFLLPMGRSRFV